MRDPCMARLRHGDQPRKQRKGVLGRACIRVFLMALVWFGLVLVLGYHFFWSHGFSGVLLRVHSVGGLFWFLDLVGCWIWIWRRLRYTLDRIVHVVQ
ncbi:hypothetical protein BU23DRAFT_59491 [Bimuria novae-zelandiae CBS 107.79]|uniref:Uncharacterized protein n=1 Tax=Bimuria novae-zelandiae CBS 107.79 TaxID=1447943 RepID=A0A6A5VJY0_9PLEO|nr:hypothetical protein BU23DRAFT_59491 [Bimuria novae-zelandiae CBS 107.79]